MFPNDIPLGLPYPQRKHHLEELLKHPSPKTFDVMFQDKLQTLGVYSLPIDLPKYRLSNGRTQSAQEDYLAKNPNKPADFFSRDKESQEAQSIQHKLLINLVRNSNLWEYFKNTTNVQEQPLILSSDGFVVNGNRRLCAMRELYCNDLQSYSHFSHVDVAILPYCNERDIDELEAHLQIQPEIKEDYSWISLACMLRARQTSYKYTNSQLADLYDKKEKEIRKILAELNLVDEYLKSRGKERQYDLVEKDKHAFDQLNKCRQQLEPEKKELLTQLAFVMIENVDSVEGRLYERIPEIKQNLDSIAASLVSLLHVAPTPPQNPTLDVNIFGVKKPTVLSNLSKAIDKSNEKQEIISTVINVVDGEKALTKQRNSSSAVLQQLSEAHSYVQKALNVISENSNKQGVEEQLLAIEEALAQIRSWLSENA